MGFGITANSFVKHPGAIITGSTLKSNLESLWNKYDKHGEGNQTGPDGKLQIDEFENLLSGCVNWTAGAFIKTFINIKKFYNSIKNCSKNKKTAISKQDLIDYARTYNININKNDSIKDMISCNQTSLIKAMTPAKKSDKKNT